MNLAVFSVTGILDLGQTLVLTGMDARSTGRRETVLCSAADVEEEAAYWLIQMDRDGTPETSAALDEWLQDHPRRRAAFIRLAIAWRRMDRLRRFKK
jgi:hypothetical protein